MSKRIALVVGGAGGIGEAVSRCLARDFSVVVADVDGTAAETLAGELGGVGLACDIGSEESVRDCVAKAGSLGTLEAAVVCAGIIQERHFAPEEFDQGHWDHVQSINTRGTWLVCREAGSIMARNGRGSIVNIASISAHRAWPTHSYAASKAAVVSLSRGLAVEWGRSGVRVNSVSPGFTLTPKLKALAKVRKWDSSTIGAQTALGRWVEPSDVGEAVAFLCSDAAAGITGIDLPVDCGWLAGINWLSFNGVPDPRVS